MAMEGLSVAEQAALLARTDVLMSPHGGALTNMVFCKPGITVVEMFSRHVFPYYYGLAANCGHQYHAILENPEEDYPRLINSAAAQSFADSQHETAGLSFDVSVDAIRAVLKIV
jgi:capsular polysaccharide biosynthesis protein